ncbi:MAG: hypothetical protein VB137_02360 [Burkholderia sp.]
MPLLNPNEMANRDPAAVVEALRRGANAERFRAVYGCRFSRSRSRRSRMSGWRWRRSRSRIRAFIRIRASSMR